MAIIEGAFFVQYLEAKTIWYGSGLDGNNFARIFCLLNDLAFHKASVKEI